MSFEQVLDLTIELPLYEKEILVDVISKRIAEDKRKEIADYYKQAKQDFIDGKLYPKPINEIIDELERELE